MGHIETDREKRVAQILATDTTREQLADALWCAEGCVRRLVERTSLLNDQISKLRSEFDKMDRWHSAELAAETDENRKLRELARKLAWCAVVPDCGACEGACEDGDEWPAGSAICTAVDHMMSELGVEVGL